MMRCVLVLALCGAAFAAPPPTAAYSMFGTKRYGRGGNAAPQMPRNVAAWSVTATPNVAVQPFQPSAPSPQYSYGVHTPSFYGEPVVSLPYSDGTDFYYGEPTFTSYPYFYAGGKYASPAAAPPIYHHPLLPYYYGTTATSRLPFTFGYDDSDPVDNVEDEMQAEEDREEREQALPVGQETWFESPRRHSSSVIQQQQDMADVNAIFLQNLILSQMYSDAISRGVHPVFFAPPALPVASVADPRFAYNYEEDPAEQEGWVYGDIRAQAEPDYYRSERDSVDEDVRALKSLVKKDEALNGGRYGNILPLEGGSWIRADEDSRLNKKQPEYNEWVPQREDDINFTDRKTPSVSLQNAFERVAKSQKSWSNGPWERESQESTDSTTTTPFSTLPPPLTVQPTFDRKKGMEEVAVPRPANPVHFRSESSFAAAAPLEEEAASIAHSQKPRHAASVYETIKHLINMQEKLRTDDRRTSEPAPRTVRSTFFKGPQESIVSEERVRPVRRFVSSEEALVEELTGLKKVSA